MTEETAPDYGRVQQRVRQQAEWIAVASFTVLLPAVLLALLTASGWTAYVNVAAIHSYIAKDGSLPGSSWGVPVAIQIAILAGEATMVLDAILRRWWILGGGAAMALGGYAVEITMHVHSAESDTWALVVAAVACGGGWALTAGLMHRGVEIANEGGRTSKATSNPGAETTSKANVQPIPATSKPVSNPAPESTSRVDVQVTRATSNPMSKPVPVIVSNRPPALTSNPVSNPAAAAIANALKSGRLDMPAKAFKAPPAPPQAPIAPTGDESTNPQRGMHVVPPPADPGPPAPAPRGRHRVTAKAVSKAASVTAKISDPEAARARREEAARGWWTKKAEGALTKAEFAAEIGMSRTTLDTALKEFPEPGLNTAPAPEPVTV